MATTTKITEGMELIGTLPASINDAWSAYTHVRIGNCGYEIRHPRKEGDVFNIYRWSDVVGWTWFAGRFPDQDSAMAYMRSVAGPSND